MLDANTFTNMGDSVETAEIDANAVTFPKLNTNARTHRKQFSDATLRTHTGDTIFTDSGTAFTFSAPVDSLVLGGFIKINIFTNNASHSAQCAVKISGTNLGDKWLIPAQQHAETGADKQGDNYLSDGEILAFLSYDTSGRYFRLAIPPFKILDATTTITFRILIGNSASQVSLNNVEADIIYIQGFDED